MSDIVQLIYELTIEGFNHAEIKSILTSEYGHSFSDDFIHAGIETAIKEAQDDGSLP